MSTPTVTTVERPVEWDTELIHSWCCDENVAWCGADVSDSPEVDDPTDCPFCDLMETEPCPSGCNVEKVGYLK